MNKTTFKYLVLFLILNSISSCKSDHIEPNNMYDDHVFVDYITSTGYIKDLHVTNDNDVYYLTGHSISKINQSRQISLINDLPEDQFGNSMGITQSENGNLYYVSNAKNTIYNYSLNSSTTTFHLVTPASRMTCIKKFDDNSFIVYDYADSVTGFYSGLKRYFPNLDLTVEIAGSENYEIVDGIGENASFGFVTNMLVVNEVIYVIDSRNNLRKIEKVGEEFSAITLISEYPNNFNGIAVENNGDILLLIDNVGIFKLNNSNNTLEEYLTGEIKFRDANANSSTWTDWSYFRRFDIQNNDLYLTSGRGLIKISNYTSKLD